MQDIPVYLGGHTVMCTEAPSIKMRENKEGEQEQVTNRFGEVQFVMNAFLKRVPAPGERSRKGEEVTINLATDPGEEISEGDYVELINPVINEYAIPDKENPRLIASAGIWFKADGVKLAARSLPKSA